MNDMKDWDREIAASKAYNAMREFLEIFGLLIGSDDILALQKKLEILESGGTADPVILYQWAWCVRQALVEKNIHFFTFYIDGILKEPYKKIECFPETTQDPNQLLTYLQGYIAMQKFIDIHYFATEKSDDLACLGSYMAILKFDEGTADASMWKYWLDAIEIVTNNAPIKILHTAFLDEDKVELEDTPENRELLFDTASNEKYFLLTDIYKNNWFAKTLPDGKQIWAVVRDQLIRNAGVNIVAKNFTAAP